MAAASADSAQLARISEQLDDLKRLMIVQLLADGVQSVHIAKALGVHQSNLSRWVPVRGIQTASRKSAA